MQSRLLKCMAAAGLSTALLAGGASLNGAGAQEKITFVLPAPAFLPAFGPWQVAKSKGYYKAEGLDVTFVTGRGGVDTAKQVGAGNAQIGGAIGDTTIIVRSNGIPVKAVALIGGRSLMHLTVAEDSGIKEIKDLKGKTITTISTSDTTYYALLAMMATAGLDKNDANIQAAGPQGVWQLFLQGKAQAMASVPDWTAIVQGRGKKVKVFLADEHTKSMAQVIIASDKQIQAKPEMIRKLVRATLKGMKDIMDDPDKAAEAFVAEVPRWKDKTGAVAHTFKLYNKWVYPGQETLGKMDAKRLAALQEFYLEKKIIRRPSKVEDLYTNAFVE